MKTTTLTVGTRVVLTQDSRDPVTHYVHMAAGTLGTVTREANRKDAGEDPSSEIVIHWDGTRRPVRTMRHAVSVA